jgi:hypothetical protein
MFGSETLDIVIGLVLIFLLFSIMLTAVTELIEARLKTRAVDLERAIQLMLSGPGTTLDEAKQLAESFYNHPLIFSLYKGEYELPGAVKSARPSETGPEDEGFERVHAPALQERQRGGNLPAYIPRDVFSATVFDLIRSGNAPRALQDIFDSLQASFGDDLAQKKAQIESWYDGVMDRASGWYKRRTQGKLLIIGFVAAAAFNINAFGIAQYLSVSDEARQALVHMAQRTLDGGKAGTGSTTQLALPADSSGGAGDGRTSDAAASGADGDAISRSRGTGSAAAVAPSVGGCDASADDWDAIARCRGAMASVGLPVGWSQFAWANTFNGVAYPSDWGSGQPSAVWTFGKALVFALLGWMITAVAGTLGAPFWFDALNKVMVIRSTVKPKEKSGDEGSEDRAAGSRGAARTVAPPAAAGAGGLGGNASPPPDGNDDGAIG